MFVSKDFVFLQLQKTACTHIARLLAEFGSGEQVGKHNRLTPDLCASDKKIIGSVRDPWDWYVSLWTFGCGGNGGLYKRLTARLDESMLRPASSRAGNPAAEWRDVYADRDDPALFRRWLKMMFDPRRAHDLGEDYGDSSLKQFAGFFTYRYLRLFAHGIAKLSDGSLEDQAGVAAFAEDNDLLDFMIRNEHLEDDLLETLAALGQPATNKQAEQMRSAARTNASVRDRDYSKYYDAESAQLVAKRERFIVRKFGYEMPTV